MTTVHKCRVIKKIESEDDGCLVELFFYDAHQRLAVTLPIDRPQFDGLHVGSRIELRVC